MATPRRLSLLAASALVVVGAVACGSDSKKAAPTPAAEIQLTNYAYSITGSPTVGGTIRVRNTGDELHMIGLAKLKGGKTISDLRDALTADGEAAIGGIADEAPLPLGGLFAPGVTVDLTIPDVAAGDYAMICFLPTEGTGKPHYVNGMINELLVASSAGAAPKADATYKVEAAALSGPDKLKAGYQSLAIDVGDGAGGLELGVAKLPDGKSFKDVFDDVNGRFDTIFGAESGPPKGAGLEIAKTLQFQLHDFNDVKHLDIGFTFAKGRYAIVVVDTDTDKPVPYAVEITVS